MRVQKLEQELRVARAGVAEATSQAAVLDRFLLLLDTLEAQVAAEATPERVRAKMKAFLDRVQESHRQLGTRISGTAFAINVVGEALARTRLCHESVLEFLKVGLYFYGLDQIERRWSARAAVYSGIHADLLISYLGRQGVKSLLAVAHERFGEGRVFCLTYDYLNTLRKSYWEHCRASEDALDVAVVNDGSSALDLAESPSGTGRTVELLEPSDRVQIMMRIFTESLSAQQRFIYLAKNRSILRTESPEGGPDRSLEEWLASLEETTLGEDLKWSEIAEKLGINEKTAKREYLRSLDILLRRSGEVIFGTTWMPSGYVKRVLEQIGLVVREKDLRIKNSTGRGLGTLVEKWEVALRFVLNHQRVPA